LNTTLELSEIDSKIGQLFMIGIPGPKLDNGTVTLIRDYNPCGVILFARNIVDPIQVAMLCRDLQETANRYHERPLFLAVDQEGGRVARLREPFTIFPGNSAIGMDDQPEERAEEFGLVTAREMKLVGLNMDLAPVVDVQVGEPEKHLEGRTFGEDPKMVARLAGIVVRTLQENGVMAVAKHFPGLGRTTLDPHVHLPRIEVAWEEMEAVNLPPFREAIRNKVSAVMTSHAIYPALDPDRPATLSPAILKNLLRDEMAFDGPIITDDLEMGAIAEQWGVAEGAADAFEAGADILLICKDQGHLPDSLKRIRSRLLQGVIPYQRLQQSCERISEARKKYLGRVEEISLSKVREYFKLEA